MKKTFTQKFLFASLFVASSFCYAQVAPVCMTVQKSPVLSDPLENTIADFNGDGKLDVATSNYGTGQMTVMLGNGTGSFTPAAGSPYATGTGPNGICNGDFNSDGKIDIGVVEYGGTGVIRIFLGVGTGSFTIGTSVGTGMADVISGDFNNDGKLDLVGTTFSGNGFSLFIGSGAGTFTLAAGSPYTSGTGPFYSGRSDFNNDGNLDVATINFSGNSFSVFLGNGTGGFTQAPGSPFTTLATPRDLTINNLNGDAFPDIAIAIPVGGGSKLQVFIGSATGTFTQAASSPINIPTDNFSSTSGDYNGDGFIDLVVGNNQMTGPNLYVLLGAGTGSFTVATNFPMSVSGSYFWDLQTYDLNNDSKPDLIATDRGTAVKQVVALLNFLSPTVVSTSTLLCTGQSATLTASGAVSYTWNTSATSPAISVSPSVTTTYTVNSLSVGGCSSTTTITQNVSLCTGVNALAALNSQLSVYPNPNNGEFKLRSDLDITVSIVNELGQTVKTIELSDANNREMTVSNLSNGIYFVVGQNNSQVIKQKIVVTK